MSKHAYHAAIFLANNQFSKLLEEFKDITLLNSSPPQATTANVTHCIETKGSPPFARPRRLTPEKFQAAKSEFQYLINLGVCHASKSPYASPLHMVRKASGEWRPLPLRLPSSQCPNHPRSVSLTTHSRMHSHIFRG